MSRKIGMIGQIVLDTIHSYQGGITEDLGGLFYSIMAADSLLESGDMIYPMMRVGKDRLGEIREALHIISCVSLEGVIEDDRPNNRVELRYIDSETREERVSGGVEPMDRGDLLPVEEFDGLLVNLVSGREIEAGVLRDIQGKIPTPLHLDLHSLLIDYDPSGRHYWRRPDDWDEWLDLCDVLQVNRDELYTIAGDEGEIFEMGARVWKVCEEKRTSCLLVTDGEKGSWAWYSDENGKERTCHVPAESGLNIVDPTGSGDVYGASFFLSRMKGKSVEKSMIEATRIAGINCTRSGTRDLNTYLRKKMSQIADKEDTDCRPLEKSDRTVDEKG